MSKVTRSVLFGLILLHETPKMPCVDALEIAASDAMKGKIVKTAAALATRPHRKLTRTGLFNGDYTLPVDIAASVGVSTITVRRSMKTKAPYLLLDGKYIGKEAERTPAQQETYIKCWTAVTSGVAIMTPESIAKREANAAKYAATKAEQENCMI